MNGSKGICAAAILFLSLAVSGAGLEKYLFWKEAISSEAAMTNFESVVHRAAKAGYSKVVFGGGLDYYAYLNPTRKAYVARAAEAIRTNNLEVVVNGWSLGYGSLLQYGLDLLEGAPIENTTYVVENGVAVFRPAEPASPYVANGGFEKYAEKRFADWTWIDGQDEQWCFQDTEVKHSGAASLRMEYQGADRQMRVAQVVTLPTNRLFRLAAWVKTENLTTRSNAGLTLFVQRPGEAGDRLFSTVDSGIKGTTDWTKIVMDFNSSDYGKVKVWIRATGPTGGCYWVDDVTVEEVAPPCVIHSVGTPITVKNEATGTVYEEGKDFTLSEMVYPEWTAASDRIKMTIPTGSAIPDGARLTVTWYSPATCGMGSSLQVSDCPCHERWPEILTNSIGNVQAAFQPTAWLISFDEWRNGNHCARCRAQQTTLPQKIAALAATFRDIVHSVNPRAKVWVWNDMFSPEMNAVADYYNVRGSCEDGAQYLPSDIAVACWGYASKAADMISLFQGSGHETMAAAFYDEGPELTDTTNWVAAAAQNADCRAIMYTTWEQDFRYVEDFADTVNAAMAVRYPAGGRMCVWTGAEDGRWNNARNWKEGLIPGVIWDGQTGAPGLPSGDTAVFGACGSGNTTIDLDGLYSIHFVKVMGEDAAKYTFGLDDTQTLGLETNGCFCVEASVPAANAPIVNANLAHTANYDYSWVGKANTGLRTYYTNACPGKVVVNGAFGTRVLRPGSGTAYAEWEVRVHNVGGFEFNAAQVSTGYLYAYYWYGTGDYWYNANALQHKKLVYCGDTAIHLAKGVSFGTYHGNSVEVQPNGCTVTIEGEGVFRVDDYGASRAPSNRGYLNLSSGRLIVECPIVPNAKTDDLIVYSGNNGGKGTLDLTACPSNGFSRSLVYLGYGNVEIDGLAQLGDISRICIQKYGTNVNRLDWSGAAETFALPVCYTNAGDFTFRNLGTGALTVSSVTTAEVANAILGLNGETSPIVYAGKLVGDTPAQVRVSGEVVLSQEADLGASGAVLLKNGTLSFSGTGERSFAKGLVSESGANVVRLSAGDRITVPSLAVTKGTLDLQAGTSGGRLFVGGATSATPAPAGVLYNGVPAVFDDDGRIIGNPTAVGVQIAARGDTVPDDATRTVGITSAGSGADTVLAKDATAVKALVQQQASDATIALGAGQTLTAGEVAIDDGWGALTIGGTVGVGSLAASDTLTLRNDSTATQTVNAVLASSKVSAKGVGITSTKGGASVPLANLSVVDGTLRLDAGEYETGDDSFVGRIRDGGRLVVGKGAVVRRADSALTSKTSLSAAFEVGYSSGNGILEIEDGAVVSNRIVAGSANNAGGAGGVYQHGGTVYNTPATGDSLVFCCGYQGYAYGFWSLEGGSLTIDSAKGVGLGATCGIGILQQTGGTFSQVGGTFYIGRGGYTYSDWHLGGGAAKTSAIQLPQNTVYSNARNVITVRGAGTTLDVDGQITMGYHNGTSSASTNNFAYVNVSDGATLTVNNIERNGLHLAPISYPYRETNKAYVNLDGGEIRCNVTWGTHLFGNLLTGTTGVDRVFIYSKGATFGVDSDKGSASIYVPLRGAYGKGVKSVAWHDGIKGMVGAPKVNIVGDGEGATAHAYFDTKLGKVTHVVVTSPGCGYTWAKATFHYKTLFSNYTQTCETEVELADNAPDGGIVIDTVGSFYLYSTNTYVGPTVVRAGTLHIGNDDIIDPSSRLVLEAGGTLNMFNGTRKQTFSDITCNGGTVLNARPRVSGLVVDFDAVKAGVPKQVDLALFDFTPGAALSLENFSAAKLEDGGRHVLAEFANGVPSETLDLSSAQASLPEGWQLKFVGNKLVLRAVQGMMLLVR